MALLDEILAWTETSLTLWQVPQMLSSEPFAGETLRQLCALRRCAGKCAEFFRLIVKSMLILAHFAH